MAGNDSYNSVIIIERDYWYVHRRHFKCANGIQYGKTEAGMTGGEAQGAIFDRKIGKFSHGRAELAPKSTCPRTSAVTTEYLRLKNIAYKLIRLD